MRLKSWLGCRRWVPPVELWVSQLLLFRGEHYAPKSRTQTQIAFRLCSEVWFLVGASPDLRSQITTTPSLRLTRKTLAPFRLPGSSFLPP